MSLSLVLTILAVVLTASSPYFQGTRYELDPCNRDCGINTTSQASKSK